MLNLHFPLVFLWCSYDVPILLERTVLPVPPARAEKSNDAMVAEHCKRSVRSGGALREPPETWEHWEFNQRKIMKNGIQLDKTINLGMKHGIKLDCFSENRSKWWIQCDLMWSFTNFNYLKSRLDQDETGVDPERFGQVWLQHKNHQNMLKEMAKAKKLGCHRI